MLIKIKVMKLEIFYLVIILTAILFIGITLAQAQNWQALPPYNVLWPLWSPVLSPADPLTGQSTPLITELTYDTFLPVQPSLVWNVNKPYPCLIYNIPSTLGGGIAYYSPYYGLNVWTPSIMRDPLTGEPLPINLPLGYESLPPFEIDDLWPNFSAANAAYAIQYPPSQFNYSFSGLLTPADVWGLPVI